MTDTTDMRRDFEAWYSDEGRPVIAVTQNSNAYALSLATQAWTAWKAGAERATGIERERCAVRAEKATKNNRVMVASIDGVPTSPCFIATAIRQGGDT